ncbi:hypothetical protein BDW22DRAFT_1359365 [Trametopsis cervina]|nr:hypothetical protein BDW22DRAFT_1359365 [Trametopsis cervina]
MPLFFVWAPDYTDPDAPRRRGAAARAHLRDMRENIIDKELDDYGGVTTSRATSLSSKKAAEQQLVDGTIVVLRAENIEQVRELLERDLFWTQGVWDKERVVIKPFIRTTAARNTSDKPRL